MDGILSIIRGGCGRSPDRATVARSGDRPQRAIPRKIEKIRWMAKSRHAKALSQGTIMAIRPHLRNEPCEVAETSQGFAHAHRDQPRHGGAYTSITYAYDGRPALPHPGRTRPGSLSMGQTGQDDGRRHHNRVPFDRLRAGCHPAHQPGRRRHHAGVRPGEPAHHGQRQPDRQLCL